MWRAFPRLVVLIGGLLMLAACGFADSRSPVPEFMRAKEVDPPPPEPPPNVKQLVRDKLDFVFVAAAAPHGVRVSGHACDVSEEAQVRRFRDELLRKHRAAHVDVVFSNAGIGGGPSFVNSPRQE